MKKILIAEDDAGQRMLMYEYLREQRRIHRDLTGLIMDSLQGNGQRERGGS